MKDGYSDMVSQIITVISYEPIPNTATISYYALFLSSRNTYSLI